MVKVQCDRAVRSCVFFGVIQRVTGSLGAIATLLLLTPAVYAEAVSDAVDTGELMEAIAPLELTELDQPATTVDEWIAQIEAELTQITGIRVEETEAGLQIVLETAEGELATPTTQTVGNALIADIPNAVLTLPDGDSFEQFSPAEGIALVSVTNEPGDRVRVAITGTDAPPVAEVTATGLAVRLGEAGTAADEDAIQVVVTGEQDEGYNPRSASTVTRTDTPLRDLPLSIQVIPQQVLRDQQADVNTALRNAPSVRNAAPGNFTAPRLLVRGFFGGSALDGIASRIGFGVGGNIGPDLTGIDRLEVIAGPSAATFGALSAGGTVNYVTKQPLNDPYYFAEATFGSYGLYRGEVDVTGPLDPDENVLYRLNASYRNQGSFLENSDLQNLVIAPVVSVALGENTTFSVESVYRDLSVEGVSLGLPAVGTVLPNPNGQIPRSRNVNEGIENVTQFRITAGLDHRFSDAWSFNTRFRFDSADFDGLSMVPRALAADNRTLPRGAGDFTDLYREYRFQTNVVGRFSTGSVNHELLFGLDLGRNTVDNTFVSRLNVPSIDIFNPIFRQPLGTPGGPAETFLTEITTDELGILLQDQITFTDNLKLLLSGRFDAFTQKGDFDSPTRVNAGDAFSPRVGIIYQPIQPISLYAVFAQSFEPNLGANASNTPFQPSRGTMYEVGVKAEINPRLTATLALYDITLTNVLTPDPVNPNFSVQTGEQNSRGVELNVGGEILPGWNIFAGYAYNDSRITQSNIPGEVGNRFQRTSPNALSLWTTYELQEGSLQGLGLGLGVFYVGERPVDNANSFDLPSYVTTDLALFYNRDNFRAAINIRNLFDETYFVAFNRNRVSYGEPFTIQGTLSWQF